MMARSGLALVFLLALVCGPVESTHFAYGTYYWTRKPGTTHTFTFTMESAYRLNFGWGSPAPSKGPPATSVNVGSVYIKSGVLSGGTRTCTTSSCGSNVVNSPARLTVSEVYSSANWFSGLYTWESTLPDLNVKFIYFSICCRLSTLRDSNNDKTAVIIAKMDPNEASSPRTTGMPREYFEVNKPVSYRIPGLSPQGYTLSYSTSPSSESSLTGSTTPKGGSVTFLLNGVTGEVRWTPSSTGLYAYSCRVSDGKSVVPLDFIFEVLTSCGSNPNCNRPPTVRTDPAATNGKITFYRGVQKKITVISEDPDTQDTTTVMNTQLPAGATFNFISRSGSRSNYEFSWVPPLDATSWDVCYKAQDSRGMFSLGNFCVTKEIGVASIIYVSGIIRNFPINTPRHVDFAKTVTSGDNTAAAQFLQTTLPSTAKPLLDMSKSPSTINKVQSSFDQWWNTGSGNREMVYSLTLSNGTRSDGRIFTFSTDAFWPVDGELYGESSPNTPNRYFTYEIHTYLTYKGGEVFQFMSSDDLWVYIDNKLPPNWNLAGIHPVQTYSINMNTLASTWGLRTGETYRVDIFFAHRHTTRAPYLQIELPEAVLCNALQSGVVAMNVPTSGFSASTPIAHLGKSRVSSGFLQPINTGAPSDSGAAWLAETAGGPAVRHKILHGFEATFSFNTNAGAAAEGFAFVLQGASPGARGSEGGGLGYSTIARSVAIEFDMFRSPEYGDPNFQHVSIHTRYAEPNDANEAHSIGRSNNDPPMTMNNGTVHNVRIEYTPAREEASNPNAPLFGWLRVYMNTVLKPVVEAQIDGRQLNSMFGGAAYVGFTSANSDTRVADYNIRNFKLTLVPASAAESSLLSSPATIRAGQLGSVVLQMRDSCANTIRVGGEAARITGTISRRSGSSPSTVAVTVADNNDGTYTLSYVVPYTGLMTFEIRFGGQRIKNAPYTFTVAPGATDVSRSEWVYSYPPLSVSSDNCPQPSGLFVAELDQTTGRPLGDPRVFDAAAPLTTFLNSVAAGRVVAVAVDTSVAPAVVAALSSIGCAPAGYADGNSFACIGVKGASAVSQCSKDLDGTVTGFTQPCQQLNSGGTTGLIKRRFTGFTVWAQSWGSPWGSGAYIYSVPNDYVAYAGIDSTYTIIARDSFGYINTEGSDPFTASFQPDITVSGGSVTVSPATPGYYDVTWTSRRAGSFQMYNQLTNVLIGTTGSPAPVTVHAGRAVASASSITGSGAVAAVAGVEAEFEVRLFDAFGNAVTQESPLDTVSATLTRTGTTGANPVLTWVGSVLKGKYTRTVAGDYALTVTVNGEAMPQLTVTVTPAVVDRQFCVASGPGIDGSSVQAGTVVSFYIQSRDKFNNNVTTPIPGGNAFTLSSDQTVQNPEVLYDGNGRYLARYTPTVAGPYKLTVELPGAFPTPGSILGSPFSINVIPGPAAAQSLLQSVPATTTAGELGTFKIESRDRMDNLRNHASEPSAYTVLLRSSLLSEEGMVAPSTSPNFHMYDAWYNLTKTGTYEVNVRLAAGGEHITGSPGSTTVIPAATDPSQCVVSGAGINGGIQGTPANFQVQARDRFENNQVGTGDTFRLRIKGAPISGQPVASGNGVYTFTYTVPSRTGSEESEAFDLEVELQQEDSTWRRVYHNGLAQTSANPQISYAVPSGKATEKTDLPVFKCGETGTFYILDRDNLGFPKVSSTFFRAAISDGSYVVPGVEVSPINPADPTSVYTVTFTPTRAGTYQLDVSWRGAFPVTDNPFAVEIVPGAVSPAQSQVSGLPVTGVAGVSGQFTVQLRDQFGQIITTGDQFVNATFTSGTLRVPDVTGVWVPAQSHFVFNYNIERAAVWTVSIYDSSLPGQNLGGSSRTLTITPAAPHAASSVATGTNLAVTAGVEASFDLQVRDKFGNLIDDNNLSGRLSCALADGAGTACGTPIYRVGTGGVWRMTYTTQKSRPRAGGNGTYDLSVRLDGTNIGSSPFKVFVAPGALDPTKSNVTDQVVGTAGQPLTLTLNLKDVYGNEWRVENRLIRAFATHTVTGRQAEASVHVDTDGPFSRYFVTLSGADTRVAGYYSWRVTASANAFVPSGLGNQQVQPGPVDVAMTAVLRRPDEKLPAGESLTQPVQFQLKDSFNNDVASASYDLRVNFLAGVIRCLDSEAGQDEEVEQLPAAHRFKDVAVSSSGAGRYNVSFYPEETGYFTMNVSINGVGIPCDTQKALVFEVTPGLPSAAHSTFTPLDNTTAGTRQDFVVTARDIYGNPAKPQTNVITVTLNPTPTGLWNWSVTAPRRLGDETPLDSAYEIGLTVYQAGIYTVNVRLNGGLLPATSQIVISPGTAFSARFPAASEFAGATAGQPFQFELQGTDRYDNPIMTTLHTYTVEFKGYARAGGSSANYDFFASVTPGLDGKHIVSFTSAWSGTFTVTFQLFDELGESVHADSAEVEISPATCAAKNTAAPYRCRDGITCAASYEACNDITLCPADRPNRCATNPSICVASIRECPCPTGHFHCASTGSCVRNNSTDCLQTQPCPTGTRQCTDNGVWTGQCRANLADCPARLVCTPGYVLCPSGSQCARDLASCSDQTYIGINCTIPGFHRCPAGQCVESLNDCPTSKSCPAGQVLCASDGSCRDKATECPQQYECYPPTPFRCSDGSCRANLEQCPSPSVCPVGWVLCENGQCAKAGSECLTTIKCSPTEVRCPDGSCRPNMLSCPSVQSCPADKPVLCGDGSCEESVFLCSAPRVCPTNTLVCPDGSCVSRELDCPTTKTCPPSTPLMCPDKNCVSNLAQCAPVPPCPLSSPLRCPDGSCRTQLVNCPSQTSCPATHPVKCQDGSCVMAEGLCPAPSLLSCPAGHVRCPGGECTASQSFCPSHVTCPLGSKRCIDGTCRDDCTGVVVKQCAAGLITCPQAGAGASCAASLSDCPQSVVCPVSRPVKCIDASCAATVSDCPPVRTDFTDLVACSDGTWKASNTQCGSSVKCPNTHPFKCFDETCRSRPEDCPAPPRCPPETPYLCPNSKCVDRLWDAQCSSPVTPCSNEYLVRCPGDENKCYCPKDPCPVAPKPGDPEYPGAFPTSCGINPYNKTEIAQDGLCPIGYTRCRDGSCAEAASLCKPKTCPFHLPHLCMDGLCVKEARMCNLPNGCPFDMPIRCPDSGVCSKALRECPESDPKAVLPCPTERPARCGDGSCAPNSGGCPGANGCPSGFIRCLDKSCVRTPDSPDLPAEQSECNTGHTSSNACPPSQPFQCANGYCALSSILCPELGFPCPKESPAQCADGSCRASLEQCPVVQPVVPGKTFRCPDGSIRDDKEACPRYNTCPRVDLCPRVVNATVWTRCENGLCARCPDECLVEETGCPENAPHKCTNGACVASPGDCTAVSFEPNGCPNSRPIKCQDGQCVATATECPLSNGCRRDAPFRCTYQGVCRESISQCPTEDCPSDKVTCADGKCAAKASDCKASNGCPVTKPILCGDGSCATSALSCPAIVTCNRGQTLCYDGSCVADAKSCRPRVPCPHTTPFKCGDGSCKASAANCTVCPATAPVRCTAGVCKAKLSECPNSAVAPLPNAGSTCTDASRPVLCFDGSCRRSYSDCMDWQKAISADSGSSSGCPSGQVLCPNGACAASVSECQIVARCPSNRPLRCWDGTCIEATATCPEEPESVACSEGTRRCEDGSCRATCPQYDGCGLDAPFHCRNRECARSSDDCVAAEKFDESLTRGRPIVTTGRRLLEDKSGPNSEDFDPTLPHVCYDNCKAMLKAVPVAAAVDPRYTTEIDLVVDSNRERQAWIVVPSGALVSNTTAQPVLYVRPVGESRMRTMVSRVTRSRRVEFGTYFTLPQTLLSPAFEIAVDANTVVPFEIPITVAAAIDLTRNPLYKDVCLAYEYTIPDVEFHAWKCLYSAEEARASNPVRSVETNATEPLQIVKANIYRPDGLVYAFVHAPAAHPAPPVDYSDWWADNLIWIVLGLCGGGIFVGGVFYYMQRLHRYRKKYKETGKQVEQMQAEVEEMEQFGGQSGTKDESVEMMANPLMVQMRDIQARLDRKNKEVLEEEEEFREKQSEARQEHITNLQADRDRLAAELEELRAQLATSGPELTPVVPEPASTASSSGGKKPKKAVRANFDAQPPAQRRKKQVD